MKKIRISRKPKPRPFGEKFSAEAEFFGSREGERKQSLGRLPVILLGMLGGAALIGLLLLLSGLWTVSKVTATEGTLYSAAVVRECGTVRARGGAAL